jgi:hypothetical protein
MAGFGDALKKGLDAHRRADEARKEMDEVLSAASADVAAVTGAPISLRFDTSDPIERLKAAGTVILGPTQRKPITALVARLRSDLWTVLAEVSLGQLGYPVTLRWENRLDSASDRASFEELIKKLLEHSATGEKIAGLIPGRSPLKRAPCVFR